MPVKAGKSISAFRRLDTFIVCLQLAFWVSSRDLAACSTPVFRYALERWEPDSYELTVFHRDPLPLAEQEAYDRLQEKIADSRMSLNLNIGRVDLSLPAKEDSEGLHEHVRAQELPAFVLGYASGAGGGKVIQTGPFTAKTVKEIVESRARREIGDRLLRGDAAVWVLLESGDTEADEAADTVIRGVLREIEDESKQGNMPGGGEEQDGGLAGVNEMPCTFSVVRVAREDAGEDFLRMMLLNSEPDLREYRGQPMAFPVFGRGRVLYALVGAGIRKDNIREACAFITGPCACEIKVLNPGIDLLMFADWDVVLDTPLVIVEPLPPLTGVLPDAPLVETEAPADQGGRPILMNVMLLLACGAVVVAVISLIVMYRGMMAGQAAKKR